MSDAGGKVFGWLPAWIRRTLAALKPPSRAPIWEWAEKHYIVVVGARRGPWRLWRSPWVKRLLEVFPDNRVEMIVVRCSAQSSKTETLLLLLCWTIAEDTGGAMWVNAKAEEAEREMIERIWPAWRACDPVARKIPQGHRSLAKLTQVHFPGMTFEAGGANSRAFLQGRVRRWLFLDEVRNWRRWALPMVLKRVATWWNSRVLIATTGDTYRDPCDQAFERGSQEHMHVQCPYCGERVSDLRFSYRAGERLTPWFVAKHKGGLEWTTNEKTCPGGVWNMEEVAKTIRYIWPCCGAASFDHPVERLRIAESCVAVAHNPAALEHKDRTRIRVSMTWSQLLVWWRPWAEIVAEYLNAKEDLRFGNFEPYKAFITETLGLSWKPEMRVPEDDLALATCKEEYDTLEPWPLEAERFLVFDVQETGLRHPWAVWAFSRTGCCRLIGCGRVSTGEELDVIARAYHVPSRNIVGDTAYDSTAVYLMLIASGRSRLTNTLWKGARGEPAAHYVDSGVAQPWRLSDWIDPYYGTEQAGSVGVLRLLLFSKSRLLERLSAAQRGFGLTWRIPQVLRRPDGLPGQPLTLDEFIAEVTAYEEREEKDKRGMVQRKWHQKGADHQASLAMIAIVAAMAFGLLSAPAPLPPKLKQEDLETEEAQA
jgi:hypothetical protein